MFIITFAKTELQPKYNWNIELFTETLQQSKMFISIQKAKFQKDKVKYLDLDNKPKKPDKDYLIENSPMMNDFGYYKTINKLPFYHLLKSKN